MIRDANPSRNKRDSFFSKVRIGSGTHPASYSLDIGWFFPPGGGGDFQSNVCFVEIQTYLTAYTSAWMEPLQFRRCIHLTNTLGQELCNTSKFSCWKIPPHWVLGFRHFEGAQPSKSRRPNALTHHYIPQPQKVRPFSCLFVFSGLRLTVH